MKNKVTAALLVALTGAMLPLAAQAQTPLLNDIDYTDVWWNPQRSGWGMNLVQQQNAAYVSLHDYKADGKPTWYVAPLARRADGSFAGDVYRHASAPVSAPLTTSQVSGTPIGTFVFTPVSPTQGKIAYTIDGQQDEQTVTRFTFGPLPFRIKTEWDHELMFSRMSCSTTATAWTRNNNSKLTLGQGPNGTMAVKLDISDGCDISGTLVTEGRFGWLNNAQFQCHASTYFLGSISAGPKTPVPVQVTFEYSPAQLEIRWTTNEFSYQGEVCVEKGRAIYGDYPN